jgi:hypothetical protein
MYDLDDSDEPKGRNKGKPDGWKMDIYCLNIVTSPNSGCEGLAPMVMAVCPT